MNIIQIKINKKANPAGNPTNRNAILKFEFLSQKDNPIKIRSKKAGIAKLLFELTAYVS